MKHIYVLPAIVAALVLIPSELTAEAMESAPTFQQLDKDDDGYVSIREATGQNELLKQWTEVDKNTDGQLEAAEFSAFEMAPAPGFTPPDESDEPEVGAAPSTR